MVWAVPEPEPDALMRRALSALAEVDDGLARARGALAGAAADGWSSAAADAYRAVLVEAALGAARAGVDLDRARPVLVRHTRAADAERLAAHAAAPPLALPVWRPGAAP